MKLIKLIPLAALLCLSASVFSAEIVNVTASTFDEDKGHEPKNIADGSTSTRWAGQGKATWIAVELKKNEQINNFVLVPFKSADRSLTFSVSYSDNGTTWTDVGGQLQTSLIEGKKGEKFVFAKPIQAKFIRLNTFGTNVNKWSAINEIIFNSDADIPKQLIK